MSGIAQLQALLARVQENRAKPRPTRASITSEPPVPAPRIAPDDAKTKDTSAFRDGHETLHGLPAPTLPPPPASLSIEPVAEPLVAEPLVAERLVARESEPLLAAADALPGAAEPLVAREPEPVEPADAGAATPDADEPLLSVMPAAFDETDELEGEPLAPGFDEFDEPGDSVPPAARLASVAPPPAVDVAAQPIPPSAISPPSEPIARIAAPLPELAPATFGGLLRRTLALRPR